LPAVFLTFISLRVAREGFSATMTGFILSSVYAGLALGAVRSGRIIKRIGHIRTHAAAAHDASTRKQVITRTHVRSRQPFGHSGPGDLIASTPARF
jgi:hypothetical protein